MENQEKQTSFFQNTSVKMFLIGFIALVLLIPLVFVQNLIDERSQRQKEVVSETTDKWGNAIELYGPIIRIPYKDNLSNTINYAYFFPNQLKNSITTQMEKPLERSIYSCARVASFTPWHHQSNCINRNDFGGLRNGRNHLRASAPPGWVECWALGLYF